MNNFSLALQLFWEFFKIGLFAVGGGPATLPYLVELSEKTGWFSMEELTNMIAVSESTPGPLGINMATYVGIETLGPFGGIISTLGLVLPSIIIICIIAAFFAKFSENRHVKAAFGAIRPAVTAIITIAILGICKVTLFTVSETGTITPYTNLIIFSVITLVLLQIKPLKKIHPVLFFVFGAIIGIIFKF